MSIINQTKARHLARRFALQGLYQWQVANNQIGMIKEDFHEDKLAAQADMEYFAKLLYGVHDHVDAIDKLFTDFLDRPIKRLSPIELAILRIGSYELAYCEDIPYKVILNEALELTKTFGSDDGYKYINGVLDQVAKQVRAKESKST